VELSARLTKPVRNLALLKALAEALAEPDERPEAVAPSKGASNTDFARKHPRVLLVAEDNRLNQKVALRLLASLGYETDIAEDGFAALEACRQKRYDIVFMDLQMPKLDGLGATRLIHAEFGENSPYIIAMTANALEDARVEADEAGMDDYVSKPIRIEELKRAITESPVREPVGV
jgi:CheY-like chemotaxis protein